MSKCADAITDYVSRCDHYALRYGILSKQRHWQSVEQLVLEHKNEAFETVRPKSRQELLLTPLPYVLDDLAVLTLLERNEIRLVRDLVTRTPGQLLQIIGIHLDTIQRLQARMKAIGL